jgi:hypothetical protein
MFMKSLSLIYTPNSKTFSRYGLLLTDAGKYSSVSLLAAEAA